MRLLISGNVEGENFTALLRVTEFVLEDSTFYAVGRLSKVRGLHPRSDAAILLKTQEFKLPVSFPPSAPLAAAGDVIAQQATCDILNLVLGPLDLNILGLEVHLNQVVLDIVATTGSGNLLGNLLCAIAGLLDPLGNLLEILDLLNQLVDLIGSF